MPRPLKRAADYFPAISVGIAGVTVADMGAQAVDATLAVSSLSAINAIGNSLKTSNVMLMSFYPVVDSLPMSPYMITDPSHQTIFIGVSTFTQIAARAVRMQGVIVQRGAP